MNLFYRNRLVRCFMGAARAARKERKPSWFTGFDFKDDFQVAEMKGVPAPVALLPALP